MEDAQRLLRMYNQTNGKGMKYEELPKRMALLCDVFSSELDFTETIQDILLVCSGLMYYTEKTDTEIYDAEKDAIERLRYLAMEMRDINKIVAREARNERI